MILLRFFAMLVPPLLLACDKGRRERPSPEDSSSAHDTGPSTDTSCDTGYHNDEGECVPAACGTGTWGDLETDESTVYVDHAAAESGDGSEAAPFTSIQAGLDAVSGAGGGMVAVAAGTYAETLELGYAPNDLRLAGRCKDLVILDASVGDDSTPGIDVNANSSEVEMSGVTVSASRYAGVRVGSGTVTLRDLAVSECEYVGVGAHQGTFLPTTLTMESCDVEGNISAGVLALDYETTVSMRDTSVVDTRPDEEGLYGYGIVVTDGARLIAEACAISRNDALGMNISAQGTQVTLRETIVEDTHPVENLGGGYGIQVYDGASLQVEDSEIRRNTAMGIYAINLGTTVALQDTKITYTKRGGIFTIGSGLAAQSYASVVATDMETSSNDGPGILVAGGGARLACDSCTIRDNWFSGVVVLWGASLDINDTIIEGTTVQENVGGGVGIYAEPWGGGPPALSITGTTIQDNAIAGVWLSGEGSYAFSDSTIHGGEGWTRECLTKCGDAVYARDGVTAWDGSSGLLLESNEILDGLGAGLFLDNASATLSGNSYADNAVDLVTQGAGCGTQPDGYGDEALSSVELCPALDYATCGDEFMLFLELAEPDSGHSAAFMRPGLLGPTALRIPVRSRPQPLWRSDAHRSRDGGRGVGAIGGDH